MLYNRVVMKLELQLGGPLWKRSYSIRWGKVLARKIKGLLLLAPPILGKWVEVLDYIGFNQQSTELRSTRITILFFLMFKAPNQAVASLG